MALGAGRQSLWGPGPPLARQQDPARGRGRPSHRSEGRATPRARRPPTARSEGRVAPPDDGEAGRPGPSAHPAGLPDLPGRAGSAAAAPARAAAPSLRPPPPPRTSPTPYILHPVQDPASSLGEGRPRPVSLAPAAGLAGISPQAGAAGGGSPEAPGGGGGGKEGGAAAGGSREDSGGSRGVRTAESPPRRVSSAAGDAHRPIFCVAHTKSAAGADALYAEPLQATFARRVAPRTYERGSTRPRSETKGFSGRQWCWMRSCGHAKPRATVRSVPRRPPPWQAGPLIHFGKPAG